MKWIVKRKLNSFGHDIHVYLNKSASSYGHWDEKHDATIFTSFWTALWLAIRHGGFPSRVKD